MADKRVIEQTASTELYNDDWFLKDSVVEGTTKISAAKLKELLGADGTQALEEIANSIAEEYDSTHTYSLNSWVFHEGVLYRCIGNNVTGTWNATKWQAKTIKQFIADSENLITGRLLQMFGEYMPFSTLDPPSIEAISKGDIFIYQRTNRYKFYRAKADHPQGVTEFDIDDWDEFDTIADLIEDVTEKIDEIEIPVKDVQVKTDSTYDSVVDASGNAKIDLSSVTAYGSVPNLPQPIATFNDGADAPMKSLKVAIEPQQDLHGYDAPWVGGAGKNKAKPYSYTVTAPNGVTFTYNGDGSVTLNGTATASQAVPSVAIAVQNNLTFTLGSGTWIPSVSANNVTYEVYDTATSTLLSNGASFTLTEAKTVLFRVGAVNGQTYNNLKVYMQIESGSTATTFAPYSNICPISGWDEVNVSVSGVNVWDEEWEVSTFQSNTINSKNYIPVLPNTTYYCKCASTTSGVSFYVAFYDADKNVITGMSYLGINSEFTTASNVYFMKFRMSGQYGTTYNHDISINYPSTDTSYHAYNGQTYTIDLDGTCYGGEVDVVSGVLTVDRVKLTNDYLINTASYESAGRGCFLLIGITLKSMSSDVVDTKLMASALKTSSQNDLYTNKNIGIAHWWNTRIGFSTGDETITTVSAFKQWLADNGSDVCYELATPLTIQLTPTAVKSLLGSNNVWADTGDINDCIYRRDMNTTINDIIARIEALENA